MNRRPSPRDKPSDRRIGLSRLQQLDNRASGVESLYPRAVGVSQIDIRESQNFPVERKNFGDGAHGDPDMRDSRASGG